MARRRLVLVVEDLPSLRDSIGRDLQSEGFEPLLAADYAAAVRTLAAVTPELVCLDLTLPRESGLELVEHIRRAAAPLKTVPIVVMSDRSSPEDMANAEDAGANAFLKKPFPRARLLKYVQTLIDGPYSSRPSIRSLQPVSARPRRPTPPPRIITPLPPVTPKPPVGRGR